MSVVYFASGLMLWLQERHEMPNPLSPFPEDRLVVSQQ